MYLSRLFVNDKGVKMMDLWKERIIRKIGLHRHRANVAKKEIENGTFACNVCEKFIRECGRVDGLTMAIGIIEEAQE